jgi:TorA maturation chaperone TorD
MMHLAFEQSPVAAAWAAYDTALIELHAMYEQAALETDTGAGRDDRLEKFAEVQRLEAEFKSLFLGDDAGPGAAA